MLAEKGKEYNLTGKYYYFTHLNINNFLTPGGSKGKLPCPFFQSEEAVFKLAATRKCSGVFVHTIFEFENQYYVKYFESSIFAGCMEQRCMNDILNMSKNETRTFLSFEDRKTIRYYKIDIEYRKQYERPNSTKT